MSKKTQISNVHKSTEKPLKAVNSFTGEIKERCSTHESSDNLGGRLTPNFRHRSLNKIEPVSPYQGTCFDRGERQSLISTTNENRSYDNRHKSSEPRYRNRFSELMNSYDSEDKKLTPSSFHENLVSDTEAKRFYNKRLIIKAWKGLLLENMKKMQISVMNKMANVHYIKKLWELGFRALMMNTQSELIEKLERAKGEEIFKIRTFRRVFTHWKALSQDTRDENMRLRQINAKLNFKKKLVVMRKWKENVLFTQVRRAQAHTAIYFNKMNLIKKGFYSLKLYYSALRCNRLRWNSAVRFERVKLLTTAFKMLHWYKNKKQSIYKMNCRIEYAYNRLAKRRGFYTFVKNSRELGIQRRVTEKAKSLYCHNLKKRLFEVFKHF